MTARVLAPVLLALTLSLPASGLAQTKVLLPSAALSIGDAAPALKVAKWIKGEPIKGFEPGKVYVLDFWATWSEPVRRSIPHLSGLHKAYRDRVTFGGIAVYERTPKEEYIDTVEKFVGGMAERMTYAVAVDTEPKNGAAANAWMAAAAQDILPTTFVVGKDGRIAWIGHPMDVDLPRVLDSVLDGSYDAAGARAASQKRRSAAAAVQRAFAIVAVAYKKNDDRAADAALAALVREYPETAGEVLRTRFDRHLDKGRAKPAHDLLRSGWEAAELSADDLNTFAWDLLTDKRIKTRDYPLAVTLAQKAVALTEEQNASIIDTLALALFKSGKLDEAIVWAQKAVDLTGGEDAALVATLAKYKKAKRQ